MKKEIYGNSATIFLQGRIDINNSEELRDELNELAENGIKRIFIDMSNLDYIDSSGLGRILYFFMNYKKKGGTMELHNVRNENVKKVIEVVRLDKIIPIKEYNVD
ncbi:MAG: hypothetical protein B6I29_04505 [Marinitoga sp. 4572_148]|nr:MAG: hypothetical protein B6I29_04505 [Marinitoga sp. 4572_148]